MFLSVTRTRAGFILGRIALAALVLSLVVSACQRSSPTLSQGATEVTTASPSPRVASAEAGAGAANRPVAARTRQARDNDIRFERISVAEGLAQSVVYCILQDSAGFMWFGTGDGLSKYDGYRFTNYRRDPEDPNSLGDNTVWDLYEDQEGALWVATNYGLDRFDRATEQFTHYRHDPQDPKSLGGNEVGRVYEDTEGALWVATWDGGLSVLDRATGQFRRYQHDPDDPGSLATNTVTDIYEEENGTIWVAGWGGLHRLDRETGEFTRYQHDPEDPSSLAHDRVRCITPDPTGVLWLGLAGGGLDRFDPVTGRATHHQREKEALLSPDTVLDNNIWAVRWDRRGQLWLTTSEGLDRFDPSAGRFVHYTYDPNDDHSLSAHLVYDVFEDASGVIWVGTFGGGVNKYDRRDEAFIHYRSDPRDDTSLEGTLVWSFFEDSAGDLWVGTDAGLNRLDRETGVFAHYKPKATDPSSLSYYLVRAILEDEEGALWVATDWGLNKMDRAAGTFSRYMHDEENPNSLINNSAYALLLDLDGALWVGTRYGLAKLDRATGTFENMLVDESDERGWSNLVLALEEDREGALWVGTYGGLHRRDPASGQFVHYRHDLNDPGSLTHDQVLAIYEDRAGTLWVGTSSGLNRFDPQTQTFAHYLVKDGLPNDMVYGILEEQTSSEGRAGALWLSTNRGLSRFDPETETFKNLSTRDGLQSDEFNSGAYHQSPSGEMFFGGINGFNAFYPEAVQDNPYVPPVALVSLTQGGAAMSLEESPGTLEGITLRWPNNFFEFEFAALSYVQPDENQYAYRLEGFDKDWIAVGTRRFGSYTNLSGGSYTLRIKGSNNDGVWNDEGISLGVRVVPPFWQTWQFMVIVGLLVAAGSLGGYELRMRSVRARARALQRLVRERTYEIERRRQVAEGLREILVLLNSDRPLKESLDYIVRQAARLTGANHALMFGYQENGAKAALLACSESQLPPPLADPDWVAQSVHGKEPLIVPDWAQYREANPDKGLPAPDGHRAMLGIPLAVSGEAYGGLVLLYEDEQAFSEQDLELCFTLADQAVLAIANDQLRDRAEQAAAQGERTRLARDLHDAVTQTLFSASLIAEIVPGLYESDQEEGRQLLKELRQLSRGALAEMRTLLLELRPAALIEADLSDLIAQLTETVMGRTGAVVEFHKEGRCVLASDVHVALYRIAQEALNNVVKHARAQRVTVGLRCEGPEGVCRKGTDGRVELTIADDGRGFDPGNVPQERLGLGIMRERASAIGAAFRVESSPGAGTVVSVVWDSLTPDRADQHV